LVLLTIHYTNWAYFQPFQPFARARATIEPYNTAEAMNGAARDQGYNGHVAKKKQSHDHSSGNLNDPGKWLFSKRTMSVIG
jgi:hypothetical protein